MVLCSVLVHVVDHSQGLLSLSLLFGQFRFMWFRLFMTVLSNQLEFFYNLLTCVSARVLLLSPPPTAAL